MTEQITCSNCGAACSGMALFCRFCWATRCKHCGEWTPPDLLLSHIAGIHPDAMKEIKAHRIRRPKDDKPMEMNLT